MHLKLVLPILGAAVFLALLAGAVLGLTRRAEPTNALRTATFALG